MGEGGAVEVSAAGEKPAMRKVDTYLLVASVEAINIDDRIVTVSTDDGETSSFKVADDTRLDLIDIGDQVRVRVTTALAVGLERPPS